MSTEAGVHRFAGWEVRSFERVLLVDGAPVRIGNRAFTLLLEMIERRGRVASKDELLAAAWPGLVVEENNLSVQIATLRRLIGPGAIVTVQGIGYRLAAEPLAQAAPVAAEPGPAPAPALVGRDDDLRAVCAEVLERRLITIVGPGGVGKTSLARAAAHRLGERFGDRPHWIDLSAHAAPAPLRTLVLGALGVLSDVAQPDAGELAASLAGARALVVLDNCEHLVAQVADFVGPLLALAPRVHWIATSQEPLHLAGESVFRLGPLPLPDEARPDGPAGAAVALFLERARQGALGQPLGAGTLAAVADICRRLDGLPLAIEMAAARVATLGLDGVQRQIREQLRLTAGARDVPDRHHTLQRTYDWSYGLLPAAEQAVFRRLGPFLGGFSPEMAGGLRVRAAAGAAALDSWQTLDAVGALVQKSLVQRDPDSGRLRLLESARDYARLQLEIGRETDDAQQAHAEAVAAWFAPAAGELETLREREWRARYLPERRNVRAALDHAVAQRSPDLAAGLLAALAMLDNFAQAEAEVVRVQLPLALIEQAARPLRARAWLEYGWAHYLDGSRELGTELARRALTDFEQLGDRAGTYNALARLLRLYAGRPGFGSEAQAVWDRLHAFDDGDVPLRWRLLVRISYGSSLDGRRDLEHLRQMVRVAERAGFDSLAGAACANVTDELLRQGRWQEVLDAAPALLELDALRLRTRAMLHHNLALALVRLGRVDEARQSARVMLRSLPSNAHLVLDLMALAAAQADRLDDAALMAGYSARIKRERDRHAEPAEAALIADARALMVAGLGEARLAELMRIGAALPVAELLALALDA